MSTGGQKALTGAAQGAAAGASFGPWGALIGGAAGGIMGAAQGDDPSAPNYQPGAPPSVPGGTSGQFGGAYYDPATGSTQNLSYGFDPTQMGNSIQNQSLYNQLMGQGNGQMTKDLDFQMQSLQQQLARLQAQQEGKSGVGKQQSFADLNPTLKAFVDKDGNPLGLDQLKQAPSVIQAFQKHVQDSQKRGVGGFLQNNDLLKSGNKSPEFDKWFNDWKSAAGYDQAVASYKQIQGVGEGSADQRNQAIQSIQNQLQYLTQTKEQVAGPQANNPMMNFLNQRNMDPNGGDYSGKYIDPWTQKMSDEASLYQDASHKNYNQTLNPDGSVKSQGDMGVPDAKALTAKMEANFAANAKANGNGAFGGERMAQLGAYGGSGAGAFINGLNRTAEASAASNRALQAEQSARRGLLGGSSEVGDLAATQGLQASRDANAANQYTMGRADDQQDFSNRFAINQHNSDVAKTGSQFKAQYDASQNNALNQILQSGFGNEMTAAQFYEALKQQGFANNQSEQQRNYGNMMQTQGNSSALGQLTLNNQRYDQGLDQQNFANRMTMAQMLQGQTQQGFQNDLSRINVNNQQAGIGNQSNQFAVNNQNQYNAATNAGQNAQNMGQWQQQVNTQAANQNAMGQAAQGIGAAWGQYNQNQTQPTTANAQNPNLSGLPNTSTTSPSPKVDPWVFAGPTVIKGY